MEVLDAVIAAPVVDGPAAMYLTIANSGVRPDTLAMVHATGIPSAEIHHEMGGDGMLSTMDPIPFLEIPGDSSLVMRPGWIHVMLEGGAERLQAGGTVELELVFRRAGAVQVTADVVSYQDLQQRLGEGGAP